MRFIAPLLLGLMLLTSDLRAQQLMGDVLPMLDTGGHSLPIVGMSFTPDGRQLVSASEDKTIRVWELATGKTVRTIRGESAPGIQGRIYAMALSPDGKWLAVGGWTFGSRLLNEFGIRLYDFGSGRLVARLETDKFLAFNLAFSPDSRYLISGNATNASVFASIWDVEQRQRKHNPFSNSTAVGFMPDGARAVTNGSKGPIVWRAADGLEVLRGEGHSTRVVRLAVAPDGTVASGDESGEIRLWDPGSMYDRRSEKVGVAGRLLARQGSNTGNLSFSSDGKTLLACVAGVPDGQGCRIYDVPSGQAIVTYSGHDSAVTATAISPDGRWAATAGGSNNEIHIWDLRTGQPRLLPDGQPLKLVGQGRSVLAVGFSADGQQISWSRGGACSHQSACPDARDLLEYAMTLPSAQSPLPHLQRLDRTAAEAFHRGSKTQGEWSLEIDEGGYRLDVKQGGQTIVSIPSSPGLGILNFKHAAASFSPDGETIISGRSGDGMMAYDRQGKNNDRQSKRLGKFIGHEGNVTALAFSPDGRILLSGATDQTLRLWNLNTRELIVSVFHGTGGEWVMWMPQGYYAASGAGTELMGWQINRGSEREAEYVTAIQFRKALNRPDIIARAIQLASAEAAAKEAQDGNFRLADLLAKPLPRLRIASPKPNAVLAGGSVNLEILLEATRAPVKLIRIQVNGQQIVEHLPEQAGFAPGALNFTVPLAKGRNAIRVIGIGESGETTDDIVVTHDGDGDLDKRGTLYVLAIGVDKYPNLPGSDLRFSGADATAFAAAIEQYVGPQHEHVVSRVLVNGASAGDVPTAANILNALGMLRQSRETDTVVVFVAGHGVNEGPNYRFLPTDAAQQSAERFLSASVIPWYAFQEAIESAKGRRILFLDTCHAGNSYNQRLSGDSYETNVIVYSAARWDQEALERPDLGHGLFTYAVVEGIAGKAAKRDRGGPITTLALRDFLVARVAELASKLGHHQEPQYFRGRDAMDYVLVGGR
jgi:WD40 repeat protein